jgi:hypothetical protein
VAKSINTKLLEAARKARSVFFHLKLAEQAAMMRGVYPAAHDELQSAIEQAEKALQDEDAPIRSSKSPRE